MEKKLLRHIIDLLTPLIDKIKCFTLSGSRSLGFINNCNDYDIIVLCWTLFDCRDCSRFVRNNYPDLLEKEGLSFHFIQEAHDIERLNNSLWPHLLKDRTYYHMDGSKTVNTCTIEEFLSKRAGIKKNYLEAIKGTKERAEEAEEPNLFFYNRKLWYYLYINVSILHNNSWDLTEKQKETINLLHDFAEKTYKDRVVIVDQLIKDIENL